MYLGSFCVYALYVTMVMKNTHPFSFVKNSLEEIRSFTHILLVPQVLSYAGHLKAGVVVEAVAEVCLKWHVVQWWKVVCIHAHGFGMLPCTVDHLLFHMKALLSADGGNDSE